MPLRGSPNGASYTRPQPGRHRSEQVVAINRNRWSQSAGMRNLSRKIAPTYRRAVLSGSVKSARVLEIGYRKSSTRGSILRVVINVTMTSDGGGRSDTTTSDTDVPPPISDWARSDRRRALAECRGNGGRYAIPNFVNPTPSPYRWADFAADIRRETDSSAPKPNDPRPWRHAAIYIFAVAVIVYLVYGRVR